jgi:hypothetical protein
MATSNFYKKSADYYYAITDEADEKWELKIDMLKTDLVNAGYNLEDEDKWEDRYSRIIAKKTIWDKTGFIGFEITAIVRAGYYTGANFDFDYKIINYNGSELDERHLETEIRETIEYEYNYGDCFDWRVDYKKIKEDFGCGIKKLTNTTYKWLDKTKDKEIKNILDIFRQNSDAVLYKVATFSNGETIYAEVK